MSDGHQFVKPALPTHAAAIAALQADSLTALFAQLGTEETVAAADLLTSWEDAISASGEGRFVLIAEDEGEFAGFVAVDGGEILTLEVLPQQQNRGHGSRLLAAVADIVGTGVISMWLLPEQTGLVRLVQGTGMEPSGERRQLAGPHEPLVQHLWHAQVEGKVPSD